MGDGIIIQIVTTAIALAAAVFTWYQARLAKRSAKQTSLGRLFSTFDAASQATIANPKLLYSVHGIDKSIAPEEAVNVAYLSFLLDGFQHYYGEEFGGDFKKMEAALKEKSTFLNRVLSVEANQKRWPTLKEMYYGEFDADFVRAIESLIKYENSKKK